MAALGSNGQMIFFEGSNGTSSEGSLESNGGLVSDFEMDPGDSSSTALCLKSRSFA